MALTPCDFEMEAEGRDLPQWKVSHLGNKARSCLSDLFSPEATGLAAAEAINKDTPQVALSFYERSADGMRAWKSNDLCLCKILLEEMTCRNRPGLGMLHSSSLIILKHPEAPGSGIFISELTVGFCHPRSKDMAPELNCANRLVAAFVLAILRLLSWLASGVLQNMSGTLGIHVEKAKRKPWTVNIEIMECQSWGVEPWLSRAMAQCFACRRSQLQPLASTVTRVRQLVMQRSYAWTSREPCQPE